MNEDGRITIVGLGPGAIGDLTVEARDLLDRAPEVWLRTARHPTVEALALGARQRSFDDLYETRPTFDAVYEAIAGRVVELAARPEGVVYAVPGHPLVGEATVRRILALARAAGIQPRIVAGLSFVEPVLAVLGVDALDPGLQIADALAPAVTPDRPALFAQVHSRSVASTVKLALLELYPPDHEVVLVRAAGVGGAQQATTLVLAELDREDRFDHLASLYVPALLPERNTRTFDGFRAIIARLRAPDGCPWDRKQTHRSLARHLLEETYETIEALDAEDPVALEEELGDLLLQVFLQAQIAEDEGEFTATDVVGGIAAKIIRRHPHVFGETTVGSADEVVVNWQLLKERERAATGGGGLLDGVPAVLPALALSQSLQSRAASVGFDWPDLAGVRAKVIEELDELERAEGDERRDEFGDLLFSLVNHARHLGIEAEEALRLTARRFRARFEVMERLAGERGLALRAMPLDGLDALWDEAKRVEAAGPETVGRPRTFEPASED